MSESPQKVSLYFWLVAMFSIIWNGMGVMSYLQMAYLSEEDLSAMPEAEQALMTEFPAWAMAMFAIAVFVGVLASLLLAFKKKLAYPAFAVSLAAAVIQFTYWLGMTNSSEVYGPSVYIMPFLVVAFGTLFVYVSKWAKQKGWLN